MTFVENDDVIQEFSAKATDHAFDISVLPGRSRGRDDFLDTEAFNPSLNTGAIDPIAVSQ